MSTAFARIFPACRPIVGMIALPPLVGRAGVEAPDEIVARALSDLETLEQGGVDGVCLENDYDRPSQLTASPEVVACFTLVAQRVTRRAKVPVGLQVLPHDWRASLAIARRTGARFVRLDQFVDRVRIAAGVVEPEPEAVIAYREHIGAGDVALLADIQVKHSELLEPGKSIGTSARQAMAGGADAIIVTGRVTGEPPSLADLEAARAAAGDFPVLVGSGVTPDNARELLRLADGAIVGTALRESAAAEARVVLSRVRRLVAVVESLAGGWEHRH
ncbi:MAG: BtpA/SgcQ family protein [Deltaproteobacteria bacterium]|nr:BtpA/SgcQ family protein [Deltaproteobacteria bacterium]